MKNRIDYGQDFKVWKTGLIVAGMGMRWLCKKKKKITAGVLHPQK
jgi:hypothetical protein